MNESWMISSSSSLSIIDILRKKYNVNRTVIVLRVFISQLIRTWYRATLATLGSVFEKRRISCCWCWIECLFLLPLWRRYLSEKSDIFTISRIMSFIICLFVFLLATEAKAGTVNSFGSFEKPTDRYKAKVVKRPERNTLWTHIHWILCSYYFNSVISEI